MRPERPEVGPLTRDMAIDELSVVISKARTRGKVYIDGSHNPVPTERKAAEHFIEMLEYNGWVSPAEPPQQGLDVAIAALDDVDIQTLREVLALRPDIARRLRTVLGRLPRREAT